MPKESIRPGKFVSFTYVIKDITGQILEASDLPTSYVHGRYTEIFPQVVSALEGKQVDDTVAVPIKALEAFGAHDAALTYTDVIENVPPEMRRIGAQMDMQNDKGDIKTFRVSKITDGHITLDANDVFAGKDLVFTVCVTEVRQANAHDLSKLPPPRYAD